MYDCIDTRATYTAMHTRIHTSTYTHKHIHIHRLTIAPTHYRWKHSVNPNVQKKRKWTFEVSE